MAKRSGVIARWTGMALLLLNPLGSTGCGRGGLLPPDDPARMTIRLVSPAFKDGDAIPKSHTCDGTNISPPLAWSQIPSSARSLVLLCDDPDAPMKTWSHWVVFNLSPEVDSLGEGIASVESLKLREGHSARQGKNDFGNIGYDGPCPPAGTHRYVFRLYALDATLDLGHGAMRSRVVQAMEGHILAQGLMTGKYAKSP